MADNLNLGAIFETVTQQLSQKKDTLNEADTYNHDHGDHMVQIFNLVQNAVTKKSGKPVADQLDYASKVVAKEAHSGSAKLYAKGLSNASKNLAGAELDQNSIGTLVKSLLSADKLSQTSQTKQKEGFLGSLLSGLTSTAGSGEADQNLGVDELLQAGLAFYQSKQEGDTNMEAVMDALMAASPMGQSVHRAQSGSLVASTIMHFAESFKK